MIVMIGSWEVYGWGVEIVWYYVTYSVWRKTSESIELQYTVVIARSESDEAIPLKTECYNVCAGLSHRDKFSRPAGREISILHF